MQVNRQAEISFFSTVDGLRIRYAIFRPEPASGSAGTVILLHGRTEFLEKYQETIRELLSKQYHIYSFDWRGQGLSSRLLKNPFKGHVGGYRDYLDDLHQFMTHIVEPTAPEPRILLAHSLGAHIAFRFLRGRTKSIPKAVLTSPMFDIRTQPFPKRIARSLAKIAVRKGWTQAFVPGTSHYRLERMPFKHNRLTSDIRRFQHLIDLTRENPDLAVGGVTFGWLNATFDSIDTIHQKNYMEAISSSILLVSAGADRIVENSAHFNAARRLPNCRHITIPFSRHEILIETDAIRKQFWEAFQSHVDKAPENPNP